MKLSQGLRQPFYIFNAGVFVEEIASKIDPGTDLLTYLALMPNLQPDAVHVRFQTTGAHFAEIATLCEGVGGSVACFQVYG